MSGPDTAQSRTSVADRDETRLLESLADPFVLVAAITVVALALRLVGLGGRVAHQDEARVAYWVARYIENGIWSYRPIVHGPFLIQVNAVVFSILGESDFAMRLVVALIGGLLPLSALLFRERLRPSETVALAALLATNPILLYYSRFMRNDVPLAAAMLFALGFFVRAYDTRRVRYFLAGVACFALGFTMKENALLYAASWAGGAVLLYDHRLLLRRVGNEGLHAAFPAWLRRDAKRFREWVAVVYVPIRDRIGGKERRETLVAEIGQGASRLWERDHAVAIRRLRYLGVALLGVLEFFAIIVFFYAPRSQGQEGIGLWKAFADPTMFPAIVWEATFGTWVKFMEWRTRIDHAFLPYFKFNTTTLEVGALVIVVLAVVGFVVDRYTGERPNDVVAFGFYWGVAGVFGYSIVMDIQAAWAMSHVVVPLAIPASVGLALVFRWAWEAYEDRDDVSLAAAAVLLLIVTAQVGTTAYETTYQNPQDPDNQLVQYAQSSSTDAKPLLHELQRISRTNAGTDVLFFGEELYSRNERADDVPPIKRGEGGSGWHPRLPLAWYFEAAGAEVTSTNRSADLQGQKPPIVVTLVDSPTCSSEDGVAGDIEQYMGGYERYTFDRFAYNSGCHVSRMAIFVDEDRVTTDLSNES